MSAPSMSDSLSRFERQAKIYTSQAQLEGRYGDMQSAGAFQLAIQRIRVAYAERLGEDYRTDEVANRTFDSLERLAQQLINSNPPRLSIKAQRISNRLPFQPDRPYITSISPRVVLNSVETFDVEVLGCNCGDILQLFQQPLILIA